jgi:ferredoxin
MIIFIFLQNFIENIFFSCTDNALKRKINTTAAEVVLPPEEKKAKLDDAAEQCPEITINVKSPAKMDCAEIISDPDPKLKENLQATEPQDAPPTTQTRRESQESAATNPTTTGNSSNSSSSSSSSSSDSSSSDSETDTSSDEEDGKDKVSSGC